MSILNRLKHGVDITKFKADQILQINRVQGEIDILLQDVAQIQKKIALKSFELHQAGHLANPELEEFCQGIDDKNRQIREKEAMIAAIRAEEAPQYVPPQVYQAAHPCSDCGFDIPVSAAFCPNCGRTVPTPPPNPANEAAPFIICRSCGIHVAITAAFCPECGSKITQPDSPDIH